MRKPFFASAFVLIGCSLLLYACAFRPSANFSDFKAYRIQTPDSGSSGLSVTFLGTSTLLFDDGESQILIDGFFSRPGAGKVIFGKIKSDTLLIRQWLKKLHINRLKAVWVCHSHYDHLLDAPAVCSLTGARLFGSESSLNAGRGAGLPESQLVNFENGRTEQINDFLIRSIPSKHSPPFQILGKGNAPDPNHLYVDRPLKQPTKVEDYVEGGCYDFYLKHGNHRILVKPSTNFIPGMLDTFPTDVLFLGAALLGKQSEDFRRQYFQETALATGAKNIVPIHWDNFMKPLSSELSALPKISDDVNAGLNDLLNRSKTAGIQVVMMQGLDRIEFPTKDKP